MAAMRFAAVAHFSDGQSPWTTDQDPDSLFADDPAAAARKWFWRMAPDRRAACERIVLGAWTRNPGASWPRYSGPEVAFWPGRDGSGQPSA